MKQSSPIPVFSRPSCFFSASQLWVSLVCLSFTFASLLDAEPSVVDLGVQRTNCTVELGLRQISTNYIRFSLEGGSNVILQFLPSVDFYWDHVFKLAELRVLPVTPDSTIVRMSNSQFWLESRLPEKKQIEVLIIKTNSTGIRMVLRFVSLIRLKIQDQTIDQTNLYGLQFVSENLSTIKYESFKVGNANGPLECFAFIPPGNYKLVYWRRTNLSISDRASRSLWFDRKKTFDTADVISVGTNASFLLSLDTEYLLSNRMIPVASQGDFDRSTGVPVLTSSLDVGYLPSDWLVWRKDLNVQMVNPANSSCIAPNNNTLRFEVKILGKKEVVLARQGAVIRLNVKIKGRKEVPLLNIPVTGKKSKYELDAEIPAEYFNSLIPGYSSSHRAVIQLGLDTGSPAGVKFFTPLSSLYPFDFCIQNDRGYIAEVPSVEKDVPPEKTVPLRLFQRGGARPSGNLLDQPPSFNGRLEALDVDMVSPGPGKDLDAADRTLIFKIKQPQSPGIGQNGQFYLYTDLAAKGSPGHAVRLVSKKIDKLDRWYIYSVRVPDTYFDPQEIDSLGIPQPYVFYVSLETIPPPHDPSVEVVTFRSKPIEVP